MSEYRLDIKVRNNIILYKLEQHGYNSIGEFCRLNNVMKYVSRIGDIIAMKTSPLNYKGEFHTCIIFLANKLNCAPEDLFTDVQMNTVLKSNRRSLEVSEAEMRFMIESSDHKQRLLESIIEDDQRNKAIINALSTLTSREQKVIEMRMGLGDYKCEHTLEEVARALDVTKERIRQIEARAYRKLRAPYRAEQLREYL